MELNSEELFAAAKKLFPGGVHSPVRSFKGMGIDPIFFSKGQGPMMTSVEGKSFIDYCQSFGPNILGHRDPDVEKEVRCAIGDLWTSGTADPHSLDFGKWLQRYLPWIEMIRFVNSGTEAVMSVLRIARAATGKEKIIKFEGCYHGHVDSMLVKAGSGLAGESASSSAGVGREWTHTLVATLGDIEGVKQIFETHKNEIAALIIEPLPANFGLLPQTKEFLFSLQELAAKNNAIFILDEVISGFRIGFGGMTEKLGLSPDLVTYGKILGGGFPVGCFGGRKDLMKRLAPEGDVYQAGTLSANPIAMRAGRATLEKCLNRSVYESIGSSTNRLVRGLNLLFDEYCFPMRAIHEESLFWIHSNAGKVIEKSTDVPSDQIYLFNVLFRELLKESIYLSPNAFEVGFMSYAHSEVEIEKTLNAFETVLDRIHETSVK